MAVWTRCIGAAFAAVLLLISARALAASDYGPFSIESICKAGIAIIMGRDPAIMSIDGVRGGTIYLSYIRQDDGTHWAYKCRVEGSRIVWGSRDGRWRTHPADSRTTFSIEGNTIRLRDQFSDGSFLTESYRLDQFTDN